MVDAAAQDQAVMRAVRLEGHGRVSVIDDAPRPASDEASVLVKVRASAICGSELYSLRDDGPMPDMLNPGHELAGEIVEAPAGCGFHIGDRVGACVVQGCGQCEHCAAGDETGCENKRYDSGNGHSEYFRLGLAGVRPVPNGVSWEAAAILTGDGLGVPVRAARRLGDTRGKQVLVIGLGPVGLSNVMVQAFNGARVMGVDLSKQRCALAKTYGAQRTAVDDPLAAVMDWTDGRGADVVIVATPARPVLQLAIDAVRRHGVMFIVAEIEKAQLPLSALLLRKEVTLMGSWYYTTADWRAMLDYHDKGLPYADLVTHVFPLDQAQQAYDAFTDGSSGKVVITY